MARERRSRGDGSIYQLPDGKWRVRVPLGRGKNRTRQCDTEREARKVRAEWLRERDRGGDLEVRRSEHTVATWLLYWLDGIKRWDGHARAVTVQEYRQRVEQQIIPSIGDVPLSKLRGQHVRQLHDDLRTRPVYSRHKPDDPRRHVVRVGLSPTTIGHVHGVLRTGLRAAVADGLIDTNPAAVIPAPSPTRQHHEQPTPDEIARIVATPMDARELARIMVALHTGLRQGEVLALLWADVHEDDERPWLEVTGAVRRITGQGMVRGAPKSRSALRVVPLAPGVAGALRAWRVASGGRGYVFSAASDPLAIASQQWDSRTWKRVLQRAGVRDLPLHGARGSLATRLDAMHASPREIADILGHAQVSTTQEHYTRSLPESRAELMRGIEG